MTAILIQWHVSVGEKDDDGAIDGDSDWIVLGNDDGELVGNMDTEGIWVGDDDGVVVGTMDNEGVWVGIAWAQSSILKAYTSFPFVASRLRPESW